jgi:hypothetical protein
MFLRDFLLQAGFTAHRWQEKVRCPFHDDKNPSAVVGDNHIYCFACGRSYKLSDFAKKFHVWMDYEKPDPGRVKDHDTKVWYGEHGELSVERGEVLYEYPYTICELPVLR